MNFTVNFIYYKVNNNIEEVSCLGLLYNERYDVR